MSNFKIKPKTDLDRVKILEWAKRQFHLILNEKDESGNIVFNFSESDIRATSMIYKLKSISRFMLVEEKIVKESVDPRSFKEGDIIELSSPFHYSGEQIKAKVLKDLGDKLKVVAISLIDSRSPENLQKKYGTNADESSKKYFEYWKGKEAVINKKYVTFPKLSKEIKLPPEQHSLKEPKIKKVTFSQKEKLHHMDEPDAVIKTGVNNGSIAKELHIYYIDKSTLIERVGESYNDELYAYSGLYHPKDILRWYLDSVKD